jgi:hypothetical protein
VARIAWDSYDVARPTAAAERANATGTEGHG